jgi:phosphoenolpyruvate synthase/pyruvate phosphate dikinase
VLSVEVQKNPACAKEIAKTLKKEADRMLAFIAVHEQEEITEATYIEFWNILLAYYTVHINVKYVVDYLEPDLLSVHMHDFEGARTYAESVLDRTEDFMRALSLQLRTTTGCAVHLILCVSKEEISRYFSNGILPSVDVLEQRYKKTAILSDETASMLFVGEDVDGIEHTVLPQGNSNTLKGQIAYRGMVKGVARIVPDPARPGEFNDGDILVAGMTRPEYLSLMKRAGAFVTDAGGVLSHAAIVARELKKPCIIGTQIATKILKNGDMVEVDAEKGIVKVFS